MPPSPARSQGVLPMARRPRGPGTALSVLIHAALAVALVIGGRGLIAPGGATGSPGAAAGGGAVHFLTLPPAPPMTAVDVPAPPAVAVPLSLPTPVTIEVAPIEALALAPPAGAAASSGPAATRTAAGGGPGAGAGAGAGPGTEGVEGYIFPPNPRGVIVPPENPPRSVRGRAYRVQFWVDAEGNVERVSVTPEIPDERYRRDFEQRMSNYRFYPAQSRDGRATAGTIAITIAP